VSGQPAVSTAAFDGHPLEVALDELAALGVTAVEPAFIRGYTSFDEGAFSEAGARTLAGALAGRGLAVQGVSAHLDLSLPGAGAMLRRRIGFAEALGAPVLITNAGPEGARAAILARLDEALPGLEAAGVTLALENPGHGTGDLIGRGEAGAALMSALGSPRIRLNLDVGNLLTSAGSVEPGLSAALPFATHAHLKDVAADGPDWRFVALGDGLVDWRAARAAMARLAPGLAVAVELPLRLRRPGRGDPARAAEPLPLPAIREALGRSLRAWAEAA
jgi:sugar phosphate isomerase/epimerase